MMSTPLPITSTHHEVRKVVSFTHDRRGCCSWILNLLWLVIGGWHMFLTWFITGMILCLTCIGIPCGWQVIKISCFLLFPFGKSLKYTDGHLQNDPGALCCMRSCNCLLNIIWAVSAGWILALQAFIVGCLLCLTIVGIPFGWQCFKLMYICFCPFGIDFSPEEVETHVITTTSTSTSTRTTNNNYHAMQEQDRGAAPTTTTPLIMLPAAPLPLPSAPPAELVPSEESIQYLTMMGFGRDAAVFALGQNDNNVEAAANSLLNGSS